MKKFDIQRETGITLTILVVTIVIILILAAITVDLSMNDNGIIKRAKGLQETMNQTTKSEEERMEELANKIADGTIEGGSGLIPDVNRIGEGGDGEGEEQDTYPMAPRLEVSGTEGENHYYISEVEVKVLANDRANTLTYTIEGTDIEQGSVTTETAIGNGQAITIQKDGTYTITAYAYNRNGKKSKGSTVTISKDTVAPTATLTVSKIEITSLTVQLLANDPEPSSGLSLDMPYTFYYQEVGANNWVEAGKGSASSYTYEGLKENTSYYLKAEVKDTAGNIGTSNDRTEAKTAKGIEVEEPTAWAKPAIKKQEENSFTIRVDQPVKVADSPDITLEPNTTGSTVRIEAISPDANGYATEFEITVTAGPESGEETVVIGRGTLVNERGNTVQEIRKGGCIVDNEPPTITRLEASTNEMTNTDITITGTAIDTVSGITAYQYSKEENVSLESEGWNTIETTTNSFTAPEYTITENGTYYFYVQDALGNLAKKEIHISNIDKIKPTITKLEGPTDAYLKLEGRTTYTIETSKPTKIVGTLENNSHVQLTGEGIGACQTNLEPQTPDTEGYATTYTLTLIAGDGNGTVEVSIQAGTFQDAVGNQNEDTKTQTGLTIDNTAPIMTITPETNSISKNTTLQVAITETGSGIHTDTTYAYCLSQDLENPTAEGHIEGIYEPNTPFTIGDTLTGTYYLFLKTIQDTIGNQSIETVTGYYKVGPYTFDNTAPTVTSVVTSNPKSKGFTVNFQAEDNQNGSGLAEENTYHIYYKTSKATGYATPIITTETTYTWTSLTPSIEDADITQDQANEPYLQEGMNPVIWVDLNENGTIEEATEEIVKYTNLESKTINPKWTANNGDNIWAVYNNCTVTYDVYVTATDKLGNTSRPSETVQQTITPPIDHKTSHFANVRMEEDGSYFTWIPRYAYKVGNTMLSTPYGQTGTIDVKFIEGFGNTAYDGTECTIATSNIDTTTQYVVHPAFCENVNMGGYGTNLNGIWVAKYESSMEKNGVPTNVSSLAIGNVVTDATTKVVSKPNRTAWGYITVGNCYTNGYTYNRAVDSHMAKNSEWGATAYLTHSQYGRNQNEIAKNDSSARYTGRSLGKPSTARDENSVEGTYTYNVIEGMTASTTGNIYGIYDMSGRLRRVCGSLGYRG